jgi:hypothetical protein
MPNNPPEVTGVPEIDRLNLRPEVARKALKLKQAAPGVVFTSGRRTIAQQAHAMATNVVHQRDWIEQTYLTSPAIRKLQEWVNAHPQARTVDQIAAGLEQVMNSLTEQQQLRISKHLTGRAFDIQPRSAPISAIEALHPTLFLQREGNLERWHVQF